MNLNSIFFKFLATVTLSSIFFCNTLLAAPKKVDLRGLRLSVSIKEDINFSKTVTEYHVLRGGKPIKLNFATGKAPKGLHSGMRVNVKGEQTNASAIKVGTDSSSFQVVSAEMIPAAAGVRQVLVLKIKSPTSESSVTQAQITSVFNEVDSWFQESSYGLLSVKSDRDLNGLADFYTVSIGSASAGVGESSAFSFCNTAKTNVRTQFNVDPAIWAHVVCILPPDMNYGWFGQAYIFGKDTVVNGNYANGYSGGYTHEIAHNLGMHHSNTPGVEYGESGCVMGGNAGTARRDFNGAHKSAIGWLTPQTVGAGSYVINAVEAQTAQQTSSRTLLKIRDDISSQDLYISYRSALGTFGPGLNTPSRTSIHAYNGGAVQTQLIATLGDGETYSKNGIVITQTGHNDTSGTVVIGANCSPVAPQVTLSPAQVVKTESSSAVFSLTVANKDLNCSNPVVYSINVVAPDGWSVSLASSSVTVAPGQSATTSLTLTPPIGLTSSSTSFNISVGADAHPSTNVTATYILDSSAPSAPSNLKAVANHQGKVSLTWLASTDSSLTGYDIYRNNQKVGTSLSTSFSDSPGTGTFSYYIIAKDSAGNFSTPSNTVLLTISKSGGGKGKN